MLKAKFQNDIKEALKSRNAQKRLVLGLVLSAIKNKEIEKRGKGNESDITDDEVLSVIKTEVKKRKDAVEQYTKGGREELAEKEKEELAILMEYMPEQMPEDAVREEVKKIISESGAKDMKEIGKVMSQVMAHIKGKADGSLVNKVVKEELSG
jgi:uncharacterized protein